MAAAQAFMGNDEKIMPGMVNEKPPEGSLRPDQLGAGKRRI